MTALLVALGGALGAVLRYLTDQWLQTHRPVRLPWGTLTVNIAGSALLGALAGSGSALPEWAYSLVGTGFCGALTTWSTFSWETVSLAADRRFGAAVLNVAITLSAGLMAAAAAWSLLR